MKKINFTVIALFTFITAYSQEQSQIEIQQISETLMNYINWTANGDPDKLKEAFHPEFNLYSVTKEDSLRLGSGKDFIGGIQEGKKIQQNWANHFYWLKTDAAIAKAENSITELADFYGIFSFTQIKGAWKIVHKSYTWRAYPKNEK